MFSIPGPQGKGLRDGSNIVVSLLVGGSRNGRGFHGSFGEVACWRGFGGAFHARGCPVAVGEIDT